MDPTSSKGSIVIENEREEKMKYSSGPLVGKGRTADVHAAGDQVVKLFHKNLDPSLCRREYLANQVANQFKAQAPQVFGQVEEEGRMGILMEHLPGHTLTQLLMENPDQCALLAKRMAQAHLSIHRAQTEDLVNDKDFFAKRLERVKDLTPGEKDAVLTHINGLPQGISLCHGDLHPDNVLATEDQMWVIDWMNGYSGHPAGDVARTYYLLGTPFSRTMIPKEMWSLVDQVTTLFKTTYLEEYLAHSPVALEEVETYKLPVLVNRLLEEVPKEKDWLLGMIHEELTKLRKG